MVDDESMIYTRTPSRPFQHHPYLLRGCTLTGVTLLSMSVKFFGSVLVRDSPRYLGFTAFESALGYI